MEPMIGLPIAVLRFKNPTILVVSSRESPMESAKSERENSRVM